MTATCCWCRRSPTTPISYSARRWRRRRNWTTPSKSRFDTALRRTVSSLRSRHASSAATRRSMLRFRSRPAPTRSARCSSRRRRNSPVNSRRVGLRYWPPSKRWSNPSGAATWRARMPTPSRWSTAYSRAIGICTKGWSRRSLPSFRCAIRFRMTVRHDFTWVSLPTLTDTASRLPSGKPS